VSYGFSILLTSSYVQHLPIDPGNKGTTAWMLVVLVFVAFVVEFVGILYALVLFVVLVIF
jgi:hypothetical protein